MSKLGLSMLGMGPAPIAGLLPSGETSTRPPHPLMPNTGNSKAMGGTGVVDSVKDHLNAAINAHASGNHKGFTGSIFKALSARRKATGRPAKLPRTPGQLGTGNPGHSLAPGGGSTMTGGSDSGNPAPGSVAVSGGGA